MSQDLRVAVSGIGWCGCDRTHAGHEQLVRMHARDAIPASRVTGRIYAAWPV
jgi:hypothetical protein